MDDREKKLSVGSLVISLTGNESKLWSGLKRVRAKLAACVVVLLLSVTIGCGAIGVEPGQYISLAHWFLDIAQGEPTDGMDGAVGSDGIGGTDGLPGEQGEQGTEGDRGSTGPQGDPGLGGRDGADGVGIQGERGPPGDRGPPGEIIVIDNHHEHPDGDGDVPDCTQAGENCGRGNDDEDDDD